MSIADTAFAKVNVGVNKLVKPCLESARFHKLISGQMALVSYVGRRSGKTFSLPVAYKRKGDEVSDHGRASGPQAVVAQLRG